VLINFANKTEICYEVAQNLQKTGAKRSYDVFLAFISDMMKQILCFAAKGVSFPVRRYRCRQWSTTNFKPRISRFSAHIFTISIIKWDVLQPYTMLVLL